MIKASKITGIIASIIISVISLLFYLLNSESPLYILIMVSGLVGGIFLLITSILAESMYKSVLIAEISASGVSIICGSLLLVALESTQRFIAIPLVVLVVILTSIASLLKYLCMKIYE